MELQEAIDRADADGTPEEVGGRVEKAGAGKAERVERFAAHELADGEGEIKQQKRICCFLHSDGKV